LVGCAHLPHSIPADHTKNSRELVYPISEVTVGRLGRWLQEFRSLGASQQNPYLFPGKGNGPMTWQGVRDSIKAITEERLGVAVNPYAFRHLAAGRAHVFGRGSWRLRKRAAATWPRRPQHDCDRRDHFSVPKWSQTPRLWGLMHRHITHNKCYASFKDFSIAMLNFLRNDAPGNWGNWCDEVSDNFRIINPTKYQILM
jgi:hypothetical protein